jgi:CheY-like chemotaxis protein
VIPATSPRSERRVLILVVERDPHIRTLERYFLEEAGYTVEFADDGLQGLAKARSLLPELLITEILVPGMDGLNVCRALKADPATRHMVVIIFSILAAEDRAREAGAETYLRKPLDPDLLIESVTQLLPRRDAEEVPHGTHFDRQ